MNKFLLKEALVEKILILRVKLEELVTKDHTIQTAFEVRIIGPFEYWKKYIRSRPIGPDHIEKAAVDYAQWLMELAFEIGKFKEQLDEVNKLPVEQNAPSK